ncbi:DUF1508 domain-containing protein [Candidatus Mycobacterium wuenschmannii]|uniref:DUF1508 domain-containing protein n=1 Tax=Candidatus Mycobacterium wuenschmannii TaxID=3027808 RepID=A0ABY8VYD2_9MYCO|nr:DUF1508 domain-containing protein [Candidatus Mycobacterium wuenschmannii]WIM87717.1 DUF1508 domain-containing protein [Candidatus Mycobacterium wuenschmannii]
MLTFKADYDRGGHPSWWLTSSNGEEVGWAGQSFASLSSAKRAAESFKAGAATARYEVYKDTGGHYRWRAWRSSDKVASSGESFYSEFNAKRAAENVRVNARTAVGP